MQCSARSPAGQVVASGMMLVQDRWTASTPTRCGSSACNAAKLVTPTPLPDDAQKPLTGFNSTFNRALLNLVAVGRRAAPTPPPRRPAGPAAGPT